jgi:hypothetical protein
MSDRRLRVIQRGSGDDDGAEVLRLLDETTVHVARVLTRVSAW